MYIRIARLCVLVCLLGIWAATGVQVVIPLRILRLFIHTILIQAVQFIVSSSPSLVYPSFSGDFLTVQDHLSSPSSSSQSPQPALSDPSSSSYSPMSNGSRESEYVPFTLDDLKIENSMDGGQYSEWWWWCAYWV